MDKCSAVMLSRHKPQVADAVIEALDFVEHFMKLYFPTLIRHPL